MRYVYIIMITFFLVMMICGVSLLINLYPQFCFGFILGTLYIAMSEMEW